MADLKENVMSFMDNFIKDWLSLRQVQYMETYPSLEKGLKEIRQRQSQASKPVFLALDPLNQWCRVEELIGEDLANSQAYCQEMKEVNGPGGFMDREDVLDLTFTPWAYPPLLSGFEFLKRIGFRIILNPHDTQEIIKAKYQYLETQELLQTEEFYGQTCLGVCVNGILLNKIVNHLNQELETQEFYIGTGPFPLNFLMQKVR